MFLAATEHPGFLPVTIIFYVFFLVSPLDTIVSREQARDRYVLVCNHHQRITISQLVKWQGSLRTRQDLDKHRSADLAVSIAMIRQDHKRSQLGDPDDANELE